MGLNKSVSLAQNRGVQIHPRPPSAATPASGGHKTGQESTSGSGGQKRREESIPGHERGHVPSAVPGATTCPRSNRRAAPTRRYCVPVIAALKGRPRTVRGKSRGTRDAAPGNAPPIGSALKGQPELKGQGAIPNQRAAIPRHTVDDAGEHDRRGRRFHTGQERGHVPSAVPARQRVPVRTGGQPRRRCKRASGDPGTGSNVSSPGRSLGILCAPTPQPPVGVEQTPRIRSTPFGDRRAEKRFGRRDLVLPRNLEPSDGVV